MFIPVFAGHNGGRSSIYKTVLGDEQEWLDLLIKYSNKVCLVRLSVSLGPLPVCVYSRGGGGWGEVDEINLSSTLVFHPPHTSTSYSYCFRMILLLYSLLSMVKQERNRQKYMQLQQQYSGHGFDYFRAKTKLFYDARLFQVCRAHIFVHSSVHCAFMCIFCLSFTL
jgi:hypothetical protein